MLLVLQYILFLNLVQKLVELFDKKSFNELINSSITYVTPSNIPIGFWLFATLRGINFFLHKLLLIVDY
jgi:hypothetical protein